MSANVDGAGSALVRTTQFGPIEGRDDSERSGTYAWLGVPFAQPPVGALRWKAPVDPQPWVGPLATKAFGNASVQYGSVFGPGPNNAYDTSIAATLNQTVGSEDCLYLNIWRPATAQRDLPVMVFIHGGSDVAGYTADPLYHGANLARAAEAVVVTVNYRLSVFGWLRLPQLQSGDANDDSGNIGTPDNLHALRWVKRNIGAFGGSADNVTLMGQSAGATNALVLMVAPQARAAGLFHRVVAISGGISLANNLPVGSMPFLQPAAYYSAQAAALLHGLLIGDGRAKDEAGASAWVQTQTNAQIADYLRAKSPAAILSVLQNRLAALGLAVSFPIPDGKVLPADPIGAIAAGDCAQVPVLVGSTRDEAKMFSYFLALSPHLGGVPGLVGSDADRFMMRFTFDPDAPTTLTNASLINPKYLPVDAPGTGYNARTAQLGQLLFVANRDNLLKTLASRLPAVWHYRFDWAQEPPPWNDVYGAAHVFDLPFLLGNFAPSLFSNVICSHANERGRTALSEAMIASLASFARSGDPNHALLGTHWPVWPATLVLDATATDKAIGLA